ncbi:hypothetical protein DFH07DRAFT_825725 [Mycena maculata]|uniref:Transmembrane protein n=1 Tax=Mycena maculata TaxID=230809 RepID=A0AAD7NAQ4_9AGAR|nr:hypothetical protein DFH07DRAFT_825725 [Mycena maculata]
MTGRTFSWLLRLIYFFATSAFAARAVEERAAPQTQAYCSTDFDWATNSQSLSPCLLTAFVWGSCFTGNWDVEALTAGNQYTNPNSTTANLCTCSWAAYNLISACTACQGFDSAVQNWAAYDQSCGDFLTDTYFPSNVTLPNNTAIPYWAATNPTTWNDGRFDVSQAQLLAQENKPDIIQGQTQTSGVANKKSKRPIGAIVGGVIGGLVVLVIGGFAAFWLIRKRKREQAPDGGTHPYLPRPPIHGRSTSDMSGRSMLNPRSTSAVYSQRPGTMYTTATMHTHTGSVHSLSHSGYTSPVRVMSPPPAQLQVANREDVIEPFTLRPTSPPASMARKISGTTMRTAYTEGPTSPGLGMVHDQGTPERVRLNPPAYSPYATPTGSPEPVDPATHSPSQSPAMRHRAYPEKASVGSQQSTYESAPGHGGSESISAIDDVIGRMGLTMAPDESVDGTHTVSTGQSANVPSRPTHKPNVNNPNNDTSG